jgi:hypothetical protein
VRSDLVLILQDLGVVAAGLVGCGQVMVVAAMIRTLRTLAPLDSLHLHQAMLSTDFPDVYIQPSGIAAFVLGAILLVLEPHTTVNIVFTIIPMLAIATIVVLTRTINRPINRKLGTWTDADVERYPRERDRWDKSHLARMTCGMLGFISYVILANH